MGSWRPEIEIRSYFSLSDRALSFAVNFSKETFSNRRQKGYLNFGFIMSDAWEKRFSKMGLIKLGLNFDSDTCHYRRRFFFNLLFDRMIMYRRARVLVVTIY